ncbi:hypothetical protein I3760_08G146200 [Carya illinoinensis]|nr:hypothetical protein I3760_08G146200 [Carya illinoinensis]KAG2694470.1 hypothetical protein I3760_08G146200 [Carya illinoinensis]
MAPQGKRPKDVVSTVSSLSSLTSLCLSVCLSFCKGRKKRRELQVVVGYTGVGHRASSKSQKWLLVDKHFSSFPTTHCLILYEMTQLLLPRESGTFFDIPLLCKSKVIFVQVRGERSSNM